MAPVLVIALVAGAYFLGKQRGEKEEPKPHSPLRPTPKLPKLPEVPELPELPPEGAGSPGAPVRDYSRAWDSLPFEVQVYPGTADERLIPPPRSPDGISSDTRCHIVAVGELWWDRAGELVEHYVKVQGAPSRKAVRNMLLADLAPRCKDSSGVGAQQLRAEIDDRLKGDTAVPPTPGLPLVPVRNRGHRNPVQACRPCHTPISFNPFQITTSAAYHRSSIIRNRACRSTMRR